MGTPLKTGGYKRILLKLSGEALMGDQTYGIHPPTLSRIEVGEGIEKVKGDLAADVAATLGAGKA